MKEKQVGKDYNKNYIRNNTWAISDYLNISIYIHIKGFYLIIFVEVKENN